MDVEIVVVDGQDPDLVERARTLFASYHEWLGNVVCSRTLGAEVADIPGVYSPPKGRLLLALGPAREPLGIIGVREHSPGYAELKRLYVSPAARGLGLGRRLAETALAAATELGYETVRLTTLPASMEPALAMYRHLGFAEVAPFYDHSHVDGGTEMLFMERPLP